MVPAKELAQNPTDDLSELVKVGDVIDLVVITSIGKDKENGSYLLSKRRLDAKKVWKDIEEDFKAGKDRAKGFLVGQTLHHLQLFFLFENVLCYDNHDTDTLNYSTTS